MVKGYALDVVIVTPEKSRVDPNNGDTNAAPSDPAGTTTTTAVTSCSDFAVYFSSSKKFQLESAISRTHLPFSSSRHISSSVSSSEKKNPIAVTVMINGKPIPQLEMFLKTDRTCRFREGESCKPSTTILEQLVENGTIGPGRNLLEYVYDKKNPESSSSSQTPVVVNETSQLNGSTTPATTTATQETLKKNTIIASAYLYRWSVLDLVVVSDIDGTVTRSDFSGIRDTLLTEKFNNGHRGICKFYSQLSQIRFPHNSDDDEVTTTRSVQFVYLTSRPITLVTKTRKFVSSLVQTDGGGDEGRYMLPPGPIFCQRTSSLGHVVFNEVVAKKSHEYKADVLSRQIVIPFAAAGRQKKNDLIISCFGNNKADARAYQMAGIRQDDIYIINKHSQIVCVRDVDTTTGKKGEKQQQTTPVKDLCCPPSMHDQSSTCFNSYDDPLLDTSIREKLEVRFGRYDDENKPS